MPSSFLALEFFLVDSDESESWKLGSCEGAEDDEG